jgi:hypothetical protein
MDAKLCFTPQGAAPRPEVAEARQSLAAKSVPKRDLGTRLKIQVLQWVLVKKNPATREKFGYLPPRTLAGLVDRCPAVVFLKNS